ncbi:MAG: hypothetical protein KC933_36290, partial [Myxococcales bacterium]|nr:hypothetical protein [Myxococcales bacterium]MCB9650936.1 hypothetical protein [Deltaproteobacteria bacterium]
MVARARADRLRVLTAQVAALADRPLRDALRASAAGAVAQQLEGGPLTSLLDEEERRLPLADEAREDVQALAGVIERLLDDHRSELPADLPADAARDLVVMVRGLVDPDGPPPTDAEDLEARVLRALVGYLRPRV